MPALPVLVKVGAHWFELRSDEDTARLLHDENSRGDSRTDQLLVRVDPHRPHTAVAETLLHELMHCCWHLTSLRVDEDLAEREEEVVMALTPWLLGVLRDNPALVAFLLASGDS